MIKYLILALTACCIGAPVFADSLSDSIHRLAHEVDENQIIYLSPSLQTATLKLFGTYELTVLRYAANPQSKIEDNAAEFARSFFNWTVEIARASKGEEEYRQLTQRVFVKSALHQMSLAVPAVFPREVALEFQSKFVLELARLTYQASEKFHLQGLTYQRESQKISLTEGTVMTLMSILAFKSVESFGGSIEAADIAALTAFLISYGNLKWLFKAEPSEELRAMRIALQYNLSVIENCENILTTKFHAPPNET